MMVEHREDREKEFFSLSLFGQGKGWQDLSKLFTRFSFLFCPKYGKIINKTDSGGRIPGYYE